MATVSIADIFTNIVTELDKARRSLTEAALWARSDWSDRRSLTEAEADARYVVLAAVHEVKDAIDDAKGLIAWALEHAHSKGDSRG